MDEKSISEKTKELRNRLLKEYDHDYAAIYAYIENFITDHDAMYKDKQQEIYDVYCDVLMSIKNLIAVTYMDEKGYKLVNEMSNYKGRWVKQKK